MTDKQEIKNLKEKIKELNAKKETLKAELFKIEGDLELSEKRELASIEQSEFLREQLNRSQKNTVDYHDFRERVNKEEGDKTKQIEELKNVIVKMTLKNLG